MKSVLLAALSALFVRDDTEQLEGMAPAADQAKWGQSRVARRNARSTIFTTIRCTFKRWFTRIGSVLRQFPNSSRIPLVFSAMPADEPGRERRSLPKQIEETVRLACELGVKQYPGWPRTHLLCYQSRVAPRSAAAAAYGNDRALATKA